MYKPAVGDMIYLGNVLLVVDEVNDKSVVLRLFTDGQVYDPKISDINAVIALVEKEGMSVLTKPSPVLGT